MPSNNENLIPLQLGKIFQAKRTGILSLKQNNASKMIHFENGTIIYATSNLDEDTLGEWLIRNGRIERANWLVALQRMQEHRWKLSQAMAEQFKIDSTELISLITSHMREVIFTTLNWSAATIKFLALELPEYDFELSFSVPQLLQDGLQTINDQLLFQSIIGDLDQPLRLAGEFATISQQLHLQSQEAFLLSCLENDAQSVNQLMKLGSIPAMVVLRTTSALLNCGLLVSAEKPVERLAEKPASAPVTNNPIPVSTDTETPAPPQAAGEAQYQEPVKRPIDQGQPFDTRAAMEFCYEVETRLRAINSGASLYEILNLNHHAGQEEIAESYQQLSKHFHPDRQQHLNEYHIDLSKELEVVAKSIENAYKVLTDPWKQQQYERETSQLFKRQLPQGATPPVPAPPAATTPSASVTQPSPHQIIIKATVSSQQTVSPQQEATQQFYYLLESKLNQLKSGANHYQLLDLERTANTEMIAAAYLRLSQQFTLHRHPELATSNFQGQLTELATALRRAYELLSNPQHRQQYDEQVLKMLRRDSGQVQQLTPTNPPVAATPPATSSSVSSPMVVPPPPIIAPPPPMVRPSPLPASPPSGWDPFRTVPSQKALNELPRVSPVNPHAGAPVKETNPPAIPASPVNPASPANVANNDPARSSAIARPPMAKPVMASPVPVAAQPFSASGSRPAVNNSGSKTGNSTTGSNPASSTDQSELPKNLPPGKKSRLMTASEFYMQGIALSDKDRLEEAAESLRQAVDIDPKEALYWGQLAKIYAKMHGSQKQAEWAYYEAMRLDPREIIYPLELGRNYQKYGLNRKALEMYQRALTIDPNNVKAQWALAELSKIEQPKPKQGLLSKLGLGNKE